MGEGEEGSEHTSNSLDDFFFDSYTGSNCGLAIHQWQSEINFEQAV